MDIISAIEERRSVRTYVNQALAPERQQQLTDYASTLANPLGATSVRIGIVDREQADANGEKLGTYGMIRGAHTFMCLAMADSPVDIMAGGYMMEQLILYATAQGLGTVWLGGTFKRKSFARAFQLSEDMILPAVVAVGVEAPRTFAEKVMRKVVKADKRKPWRELFFDGSVEKPLSELVAGDYAKVLEMVRLAPSATNTQPWRVIKQGDAYHFYAQYKDGISALELRMRHLDMGIALAHFVLSAEALGLAPAVSMADPALPGLPADYRYCYTAR